MMLDGKTMMIAGAACDVSMRIARTALDEGANVILVDRAATLSDELRDFGTRVAAIDQSVSDLSSAENAVTAGMKYWSRIDAVVNAQRFLHKDSFLESDPDNFERQIAINLVGAFAMARAIAPHFKAQNVGAFVHLTSISALAGSAQLSGYAAAKVGVIGLSRTLSFDMAKFNIRSNCIAYDDSRDDMTADQAASLSAFLASDAAHAVTGQVFGTAGNKITLYSQPRPIRLAQNAAGWTAETIARDVIPTWHSALTSLGTGADDDSLKSGS